MLALPQVLGVEAVGGLYQPLGSEDGRPRGAIRDDADPGLRTYRPDRATEEELDALLDGVLGVALEALAGIRAGALAPRPSAARGTAAARTRRSAAARPRRHDRRSPPSSRPRSIAATGAC